MKLSEIKRILKTVDEVNFQLENGEIVPNHFHVTEVGIITKNFVDCGGTLRNETIVNFQLWEAGDYDHRLAPEKLTKIIELAENKLEINVDLDLEVEYQQNTIGKFGIEFKDQYFILTATKTACLAIDSCGIPAEKQKISFREISKKDNNNNNNSCAPGGGCC